MIHEFHFWVFIWEKTPLIWKDIYICVHWRIIYNSQEVEAI